MSARLREFRAVVGLQAELVELVGRSEAGSLLRRFRAISRAVQSPHNESHVLAFAIACLRRRDVPGVLVEAGCFKGSSTAKFSLIARMIDKRLVVFDSFQGLPDNTERHERSLEGHSISGWFDGGKFRGSLDEVRGNVAAHGCVDVCEFVPGWFDDTLPGFGEQVTAAYLDVDLASSTETCLRYLHPLIAPGGVIVSQDGDFPLVVDAIRGYNWGCQQPRVEGLGESKIVYVHP